jgi:hypothetical protein
MQQQYSHITFLKDEEHADQNLLPFKLADYISSPTSSVFLCNTAAGNVYQSSITQQGRAGIWYNGVSHPHQSMLYTTRKQ